MKGGLRKQTQLTIAKQEQGSVNVQSQMREVNSYSNFVVSYIHTLELANMWVAAPSLEGQINHTELPVAEVNFTLKQLGCLLTHAHACGHVAEAHIRGAQRLNRAEQVGLMPESHLSRRASEEAGRDIAFI